MACAKQKVVLMALQTQRDGAKKEEQEEEQEGDCPTVEALC